MARQPWMPLYVRDLLFDTLGLDGAEFGTYVRMMALAWNAEDGCLPEIDELKAQLRRIGADHGHTINRVVPKLLALYWTCEDNGRWSNKRLAKERQKSDKLSAKQTQNAAKRWSKTSDNNNLVDATAMPARASSQSQSQSKKEKSTRAGRALVPEDWAPSEAGEAKGRKVYGHQFGVQLAKFRDHHRSKGTMFVDFEAAWRTWMANGQQWGEGAKPPPRATLSHAL